MTIESGSRTLHACLVEPSTPARAGLVICHGIGEVVEQWAQVQDLLAEQGIASLVFDYAGYGRSSGFIAAKQCEHDAKAAFGTLQALLPSVPVSLLGFSLGSGIAVAVLSQVPAQSLILCAAFTSFRAAAARMGVPARLLGLLPPIWSNATALRAGRIPVLIVHGDADTLFPMEMALELREACAGAAQLMVAEGAGHDALYAHPQRSWWQAIAHHVLASGPPEGSTPVLDPPA